MRVAALIMACRSGPPEAGGHNPDLLQVLDPCKQTEGVVVDVAHEDDDDYHVWFKSDRGREHLLNPNNHFQAKPAMLAEITQDCPASTNPPDAESASRCPKTNLPIPKLGQHIAIDGPGVLDTDHGCGKFTRRTRSIYARRREHRRRRLRIP